MTEKKEPKNKKRKKQKRGNGLLFLDSFLHEHLVEKRTALLFIQQDTND